MEGREVARSGLYANKQAHSDFMVRVWKMRVSGMLLREIREALLAQDPPLDYAISTLSLLCKKQQELNEEEPRDRMRAFNLERREKAFRKASEIFRAAEYRAEQQAQIDGVVALDTLESMRKSLDQMVKISESITKLTGVDALDDAELTGKEGANEVTSELAKMIADANRRNRETIEGMRNATQTPERQ